MQKPELEWSTLRKMFASMLAFSLIVMIGACASYKSTLTNARGEQVTCEASGKSGIITGHYLRQGFEDCIAAAKAKGFTEPSPKQ